MTQHNVFFEGRIEVISGCMFAGKTGELLRRLRRAQVAEYDIRVFTPAIDNRYGQDCIGSHNGNEWSATVLPVDESGQEQLYRDGKDADIIAVDEFNFFSEEFLPVLNHLADEGVRVIISGLDQTFRGDPFHPMDSALAIADSVTKLTAICDKCGRKATRTQRLIDGEPAPANSPTVQVGGKESYQARCRNCHDVPVQEQDTIENTPTTE